MLEELRNKLGESVRENEPLAKYTTYRIGGPARYYVEAQSADQAVAAVAAARELELPYYVLGGGSNVLVHESGFEGLVVRMANRGIEIDGARVTAQAGTPTAKMALETTEAGLTGFEWAIGIPGTVGGAVRGNAGAFDGETGDAVVSMDVFKDGERLTMTKEQCEFGYRDSCFKHLPGTVVLAATFELAQSEDRDAGLEKLKDLLRKKAADQPVDRPTAGCMFKNWQPESEEELKGLRGWLDLNPDEQVPVAPNGSVSAGWIIDRAQMKGTKVGKARVSEKHANFIVIEEGAETNDIIALMATIKSRVRKMTEGIVQLQEEVEYVGF
ncbi:UDP-N-acetylmuramate dehydrogenase [Patescibacteria group bacterium]